MIVICCPSFNEWPVTVITAGLAFVAAEIVSDVAVERLCTTPVAPEVLPVTTSPVVNAWAVLMFKCVYKTISKR